MGILAFGLIIIFVMAGGVFFFMLMRYELSTVFPCTAKNEDEEELKKSADSG